MIKFDEINIYNAYYAFKGARNSYKSWDKMDSSLSQIIVNQENDIKEYCGIRLGESDLKLFKSLVKGGPSHRKFLRQISVSMNITAPLYWWKQYSTFKVGTVENSESTMHSLLNKELTINDFSFNDLPENIIIDIKKYFLLAIDNINIIINYYKNSKVISVEEKKIYFQNIIALLPDGYNQMRTCTMNYENLLNIYQTRKNHKLQEWTELCKLIEQFPYFDIILESLNEK